MNIQLLNKMMKISLSESKRNKEEKIAELGQKFNNLTPDQHFSPTMLIKVDEHLIAKMVQ
jgi:hypothetical protein